MQIYPTDNILFLDDDVERRKFFRSVFPSATIVETAQECINQFKKASFDVVFLDHDLGGKAYVSTEESGHGSDVVRWLVVNKPIIRNIILHTCNTIAVKWMFAMLNEVGYNVICHSFVLLRTDLEKIK